MPVVTALGPERILGSADLPMRDLARQLALSRSKVRLNCLNRTLLWLTCKAIPRALSGVRVRRCARARGRDLGGFEQYISPAHQVFFAHPMRTAHVFIPF